MNYIVAVRMAAGGTKCEHISDVIWVQANFASGRCPVATMVDFINKNPGTIAVTDGKTKAAVEVVNAKPPYIRSEKDASKTDNLLNLPRF